MRRTAEVISLRAPFIPVVVESVRERGHTVIAGRVKENESERERGKDRQTNIDIVKSRKKYVVCYTRISRMYASHSRK